MDYSVIWYTKDTSHHCLGLGQNYFFLIKHTFITMSIQTLHVTLMTLMGVEREEVTPWNLVWVLDDLIFFMFPHSFFQLACTWISSLFHISFLCIEIVPFHCLNCRFTLALSVFSHIMLSKPKKRIL